MTKKRCTDCKYTKGIGYDFWCGEGHTEYEVFGAETNCPYFEYHDWSKGTPSRTEKRFTKVSMSEDLLELNDNGKYTVLNDINLENLLNELNEENEQLKQQMLNLNEDLDYFKTKVSSLEKGYLQLQNKEIRLKKENAQLKKQIKIFDEFLDGNNLDIDWNELCILDSCMMNDGVECRDCIYMGWGVEND